MNGWENMLLYLILMVGCFIAFMANVFSIVICYLKRKKLVKNFISLGLTLLLTAGAFVFMSSHPTYYKYNDIWVTKHSSDEIQARYGAYDIHTSGMGGYYIYSDTDGMMPDHLRHYYCIYFSTEGQVLKIEDRCQMDG